MRSKSILVSAAAILVVLGLCGSARSGWSTPVPVLEVNTAYGDSSPFLSFDGLTLYFVRVDTDTFYYARIYKATRPEPYGPFTSVQNISELNYSGGHVASPWVSPDNLRMYYYRTEPGSLHRLKVSQRAAVTDPWPIGSNISELNSLGNLNTPSLTQDELIIVFISADIPGGIGDYDIYIATRPDRYSSFGNVRNLSEINSTTTDGAPYISPDGLTLLFHSNRNGSTQIFRATRGSLSEPFGNLEHLSLFDTPGGGSGFSRCSSDGKSLYFTSWLSGEPSDIYVSYSVPIAHWKFDEGSGSIAYDSAGTNDGTIYGATWAIGQINGALSFDGMNDYVDIPYDSSLDIDASQGISVSVWINLNSYPAGWNQGPIFGLFDSTGAATKNYLLIDKPPHGNLITWDQYPPYYGCLRSIKPDLDTWYHVAVVEDSTYRAIYINGSLDISDNTSESYQGNPPDTIRIGSRADIDPFYFDGSIDDVMIFDRALSAEEVQQLYESGLPILVDVDIKPGSCPNPLNVKSLGLLPVAILGSEDFDVSTIDVASIRLAGVAPIRSSYEDVATPVSDSNECECSTEGPDGFLDLTLKFETQRIVEAIGEVDHGDELVLELTGVLSDETPIEGSDCVIIRGKHKPLNKADFNGDGTVDMADFAAFAENWLQSSIVEY